KKAAPPRGILKSRETKGAQHHARYLPSKRLAGFIEHYWFVSWDFRGLGPQLRETLPHPSVHIVLENDSFRGRSRAARPCVLVGGVHVGRFSRILEGRGNVFGIKFLPGAFYPFVKFPISNLTGRIVSIKKIFGSKGASFEKAVLAGDPENEKELVALAEAFFLARLPKKDANVEWIGMLVERIVSDRTILKVDDLIRAFDLDKRKLQRLFKRYVGISPKWMIQRYRLHEALAALESRRVVNGAAFAQDLGYFDQAHFIKDFKRLVGVTPAEYLKAG
ncbi:MAG: AraC family transcriptional regulator, partial [Spirochaetia bacterium]|nr:AraC family transcriptional regulator [Spirochaetia bacterium]